MKRKERGSHEAKRWAGREDMFEVVDRGVRGFDVLAFEDMFAFGLESSESGGVSMVGGR